VGIIKLTPLSQQQTATKLVQNFFLFSEVKVVKLQVPVPDKLLEGRSSAEVAGLAVKFG